MGNHSSLLCVEIRMKRLEFFLNGICHYSWIKWYQDCFRPYLLWILNSTCEFDEHLLNAVLFKMRRSEKNIEHTCFSLYVSDKRRKCEQCLLSYGYCCNEFD